MNSYDLKFYIYYNEANAATLLKYFIWPIVKSKSLSNTIQSWIFWPEAYDSSYFTLVLTVDNADFQDVCENVIKEFNRFITKYPSDESQPALRENKLFINFPNNTITSHNFELTDQAIKIRTRCHNASNRFVFDLFTYHLMHYDAKIIRDPSVVATALNTIINTCPQAILPGDHTSILRSLALHFNYDPDSEAFIELTTAPSNAAENISSENASEFISDLTTQLRTRPAYEYPIPGFIENCYLLICLLTGMTVDQSIRIFSIHRGVLQKRPGIELPKGP
jgi:hypothetical protein